MPRKLFPRKAGRMALLGTRREILARAESRKGAEVQASKKKAEHALAMRMAQARKKQARPSRLLFACVA